MQLLDHVSIAVRDIEGAKRFYKAALGALGAIVAYERADAVGFGERNRPGDAGHTYISVFRSDASVPDAKRHWCFRASSAAQVRAFHAAGLAAGGRDEGAPGIRSYHPKYFAAFLLDPDGNKIEAVCHQGDA